MAEILLAHGNYQELESYRNSVVIFDATQEFCTRFLKKGDRTIDQMIQAARSGKQNIIEGSMASGTSTETEIKLVGVARASLEELLEDYRDYLRTHHLTMWTKDDPRTLELRAIAKQKNKSCETYKSYLTNGNAEVFCNLLISLIHQTNYLLDRQLKSLEKSFVEKGGLRERMYHARQKVRFLEELNLLRELYREIQQIPLPQKDAFLQKIRQIADSLKKKGGQYPGQTNKTDKSHKSYNTGGKTK